MMRNVVQELLFNYTLHLPSFHGMEEKVEPYLPSSEENCYYKEVLGQHSHIFLALCSCFLRKVGFRHQDISYKKNNEVEDKRKLLLEIEK